MQDLMTLIQLWLIHYGNFALFFLLALGIVGLPIPDETLMTFAGLLMAQGKFSITFTIITALAGSIAGITLSYFLGKTAGLFLLVHYGRYIGVTPQHLEKVHRWFEKIGKWSLLVGYFIPGVRHFTGYVAGTLRLEYKIFALFAYIGALIWVSTFLSLGYFIGQRWEIIVDQIDKEILWISIGILIVLVFLYLLRRIRRSI